MTWLKLVCFRNTPEVLAKVNSLSEMFQGKKVIIGRDKLDPIKGISHKLCAFDKFLTDYPEWRLKAVLIQVTVPQPDSRQFESKLSEMVSEINSKHYNHAISRVEYFSLLTMADACLITCTRDGMNLTSHEYIVCQQERKNPLILSEFTGTAGSLSAAIHINPWDYTVRLMMYLF
jgi:trehalose-6-phosphate synthase